MNPTISVIMPTHNREKFLVSTIESIINQSFEDWELIIIDDHSSDQTEAVVKSIHDPRIKYFKLLEGSGPGAARDFGIRQAQAEILCLCDDDDLSLPDRLRLSVDKLSEPAVDVVYGDLKIKNIETNEESVRPSLDFSGELLKRINFIPNPTASLKTKAYFACGGYDVNLRTSEDYDLWLRLHTAGYGFAHINSYLVQMRVHSESLTKSVEFEKRKQNLRTVRERYNLPLPDRTETLGLIDPSLRELFSTEGAQKFWFND